MSLVPAQGPDADLVDRRYLSQFDSQQVGFTIQTQAGAVDADNNSVVATMSDDRDSSLVVFSRPVERLDVGTYATTLTATETNTPGPYTIRFDYAVDGTPDYYALQFEVGSSAPAYDALPLGMKMIVEEAYIKFADLYDSPLGGPHLQIYMQSHFGRNRMAQLLRQALQRLNIVSQPQTTYVLDDSFPYVEWGGLLVHALYVETIKHLRRSYVEIPDIVLGTSISRGDRRDYMDRWGTILAEETEDLRLMLDNFKMAHMGLGNVSVLVSGGVFGRLGPVGWGGSWGTAAARGYFFGVRAF